MSAWTELGRRIDRPRLLCVCARARAMLASARDEHADALIELERALVLHDRLGDPFERGRTLLLLGGVRRRLGQRRAARDALQEAVAVFDDVGAAGWAARGRTELGRISGRRREETGRANTYGGSGRRARRRRQDGTARWRRSSSSRPAPSNRTSRGST